MNIYWQNKSEITQPLTVIENSWLFSKESLTKLLTQLSCQQFAVEVLYEGWQKLRIDEYQKLQVNDEREGWVREVILKGKDIPWVYARSVSMQTDLNNHHYDLGNLGSNSLGWLLFQDPSFTRSPIEVCHYPEDWLPDCLKNNSLWGRRSCLANSNISVLVQEIFLPAFWQEAEKPIDFLVQ